MNRRTLAVAALGWVLVVVLGSGLVWAVVSRAGEGVVSTTEPVGAGAGTPAVGKATQAATRSPDEPSGHHTGDDRGGHDGRGDDGGPDDHSGDGHATSGPSGSPGAGSTGGTTGGGSTRSSNPSPDPGPSAVPGSWTGSAGTVKVACTGATISFESAYPNDGYRYEVGNRGPEHVEVEFENTSTERKTTVTATCSSGTPTFRVETDAESGDD